jgi:hypothetical protein
LERIEEAYQRKDKVLHRASYQEEELQVMLTSLSYDLEQTLRMGTAEEILAALERAIPTQVSSHIKVAIAAGLREEPDMTVSTILRNAYEAIGNALSGQVCTADVVDRVISNELSARRTQIPADRIPVLATSGVPRLVKALVDTFGVTKDTAVV